MYNNIKNLFYKSKNMLKFEFLFFYFVGRKYIMNFGIIFIVFVLIELLMVLFICELLSGIYVLFYVD